MKRFQTVQFMRCLSSRDRLSFSGNLDMKEKDALLCKGTERHWESVGIVNCLQNARTNNQTICKQQEDKSLSTSSCGMTWFVFNKPDLISSYGRQQ